MENRIILDEGLSPEQIVAGQLAAYNARDIEMFMSFWELDAEIYQHPDTLLSKGYGDIRARHVVRFLEPDLKAVLVSRTVMGNKVVDTERVTRNFPNGKGEVDVVGIYEILDGRIKKAWFLTGPPRMASAS
ncbi:steroid delta-isomerase [Asticcacaulis sp. AC460]|uniref:nuclear transport factor 2 family protein n=1 Tax=Asticcacaulis sp. AC460 TaxID=1282360 RepID=UPI0003C3DCBF|nr:nuclear transport factor 2 family protein [Asticcacaulis sp. AC460]ESQ92981.1 steroid delta-isomerase [Asticcacaulis sp. AC460]